MVCLEGMKFENKNEDYKNKINENVNEMVYSKGKYGII